MFFKKICYGKRDSMRGDDALKSLQEIVQEIQSPSCSRIRVLVGMATCGIASGAKTVETALRQEIEALGLDNVDVVQTGCIGLCQYEPLVEVLAPGQEKVTYIRDETRKKPRRSYSGIWPKERSPRSTPFAAPCLVAGRTENQSIL